MTVLTLLFTIAAQIDPKTGVEIVKETSTFLSQKDLQWWFAFLFVLLAGVACVIGWLLFRYHNRYIDSLTQQLTEQRQTAAAIQERLVSYLASDRAESLAVLREVTESNKEISLVLKEVTSMLTELQVNLRNMSNNRS